METHGDPWRSHGDPMWTQGDPMETHGDPMEIPCGHGQLWEPQPYESHVEREVAALLLPLLRRLAGRGCSILAREGCAEYNLVSACRRVAPLAVALPPEQLPRTQLPCAGAGRGFRVGLSPRDAHRPGLPQPHTAPCHRARDPLRQKSFCEDVMLVTGQNMNSS
jgi:hypothetical protein